MQIASGLPSFAIVGLPDKAVAESRERVRAALGAMGLALPPRRIIVNLAPADLAKEGSHFDLPIALGVLIVMGVLPVDTVEQHLVLGELALDGGIRAVAGVLPAAVAAAERGLGLICPAACGAEAAWLKDQVEILAAPSLLALINHARGSQLLTPPEPGVAEDDGELSRPARRQGPGDRQAGAGDRRRRRPQPDAGGPARGRQVDAGGAPDRHPAAAGPGRGARGQHDRERRRPARRRPAVAAAAVPQPAPCRLDRGHGRRRQPGAAGRDLARPSGRAVPGRAARVRPRGAGIPAPAARGRPDHGGARPGPHHLPGALPARGRDEPLPLRPSRRSGAGLPARAALRRRLPGAHLRPAARPHRPLRRGAGAERRRHDAAAAARGQRRGRGAGGGRASAPVRPLRRRRPARSCGPTARPTASCSRRSPSATSRRMRCCAGRRSSCISARAATIASCGWRARSPTSTAARRSASRTSPRRSRSGGCRARGREPPPGSLDGAAGTWHGCAPIHEPRAASR